jgi:hypothetical protein
MAKHFNVFIKSHSVRCLPQLKSKQFSVPHQKKTKKQKRKWKWRLNSFLARFHIWQAWNLTMKQWMREWVREILCHETMQELLVFSARMGNTNTVCKVFHSHFSFLSISPTLLHTHTQSTTISISLTLSNYRERNVEIQVESKNLSVWKRICECKKFY